MRRLGVRRWQYALCCWSCLACVLALPAFAQEIVLSEAIRAVQARRLAPPETVQFVTMRLRQQLRNQVRIVE